MANSKDDQVHKDKYHDTSKKILSQEMLMCDMKAVIFTILLWIIFIIFKLLLARLKFQTELQKDRQNDPDLQSWGHKNHYLVFENWMVDNLFKLEFPSHKDTLPQVWLKLVQSYCKRQFLNSIKCIFTILLSYPLGKGGSPSFQQTWISFTQGCSISSSSLKLPPPPQFYIFSLSSYKLLLGEGGAPPVNKLEFPSSKNALCEF